MLGIGHFERYCSDEPEHLMLGELIIIFLGTWEPEIFKFFEEDWPKGYIE